LFSKKRNHYLTIGYKDASGKDQAAVFELGKDIARTALIASGDVYGPLDAGTRPFGQTSVPTREPRPWNRCTLGVMTNQELAAKFERLLLDNPELERLEAIVDTFNPFLAMRSTRQEVKREAA
jgi:hypothetical protein